ncbi:triose-phosphate transporter family-domain-containing protein [Coniochaeta sp. 2T2.1]|nr:triose-phosphate transporter family-domain-containing protein [Coniochaeta sp. 2T2.1]
MPHSTSTGSHMRAASQHRSSSSKPHTETTGDSSNGTEKFPDFDAGIVNGRSASPPRVNGYALHGTPPVSGDRWQARRDSRVRWAPNGTPVHAQGHNRRTSISQTFRHMRSASVSQNAHEIADALRAPVSWKLIGLCVTWYWSSALTNTSSKSILTAFDKPATLTIIQFAFVAIYCLLFSWLASRFPRLRTSIPALKHPIRYPSKDVIMTTLPLAGFQIAGHLLSSNATSKIPVSLVHTIKGLSPLFTVLAYRFIFDIRYPRATYYSLIPLTIGVMLACSGKNGFSGHFLGILYALLATIIFVTQNIFSKRLFNEAAIAEAEGFNAKSRKLDKLNLLCYSSGLAFLITGPIWFCSEGINIIADFLWDGSVDLTQSPNSFDHGRLTLEYVFNGTFHFGQNILAFVLLSKVSPVTYSVASLLKRVFVIFIAIIWFRNPTTNLQAVGIGLTFFGLYLYDRSSEKNKADQRARTMTETRGDQSLLPLNTKNNFIPGQVAPVFESPIPMSGQAQQYIPPPNGAPYMNGDGLKKSDDAGRGRARGNSNAPWLPPGTKQEDTWRSGDQKIPTVT